MISSSCVVAVRRGWTQTLRRLPPVLVPCCLQSTQPVAAARLPYRVKLSAGKRYAWCACGHSKKQPFCDGTHLSKAPTIHPLRFTPDKDKAVMLCACKQTKGAPYCDGSHFKVIFQDLVKSIKGVFK
ncbi:CDGSH iron-sulfur domain-containing protein 3, mitochondrial-like [Pungitius pungitius]|uniref:CDGSH iron-sulfur domain-containing protein 3, mitochondrial-like n=1 Tax=Pungitius pungitius TaxID=134920 RepID=UPI0018876226|nr:CDGSH iron-sulfur domain-containing protein 3, mitochondrial-like [Pungitius pungitius]